jgi:hypothetical protein
LLENTGILRIKHQCIRSRTDRHTHIEPFTDVRKIHRSAVAKQIKKKKRFG